MKNLLLVLILLALTNPVLAQSIQRSTIEDRLIGLEKDIAVLREGQKGLTQRIDDLDSKLSGKIDDLDSKLSGRIDDIKGLIYVILAGMFALVGFVIWDRRTALAPAIRKNKELEEREEKIERALKEFASKEPRLADALRHTGLL